MNTRLLMTLRVTVATPQSIGAVPHGTRRTVPITGATLRARDFADLSCLVEAPTGSSFEWMRRGAPRRRWIARWSVVAGIVPARGLMPESFGNPMMVACRAFTLGGPE